MFRAHLIQVKVHVNFMCVNDNGITKMMITNFTSYQMIPFLAINAYDKNCVYFFIYGSKESLDVSLPSTFWMSRGEPFIMTLIN